MRNISLQFINTKLEKQYIQQHGTNLRKYFINSQILYLACLVSLAIYTLVLNFTMRAFALEMIGIIINLITFYVGCKKRPSLIPHILLGDVLFIALYQLSYIPSFARQTGANPQHFPHLYDPMQAYIIGFQVGILTISLVSAPNFYNSLVQMVLICSLVFAMGATSGVTIFMFPLPFTSALTIYSAHYRQRIQRLNFLANRQQNCDDFVVRNSLDSAFIKVKLNDSEQAFVKEYSNKKFDLMLLHLKLDFIAFFRELKLIENKKQDLELWLWNKTKQLVYSSSNSDMYKDLGSAIFEFKIYGQHKKLKVKVLTSFIHQIDLFLIFKEEDNPLEIRVDDKSSLQKLLKQLFLQQRYINLALLRKLMKLEKYFKNTPISRIFYRLKLTCFKEVQLMYTQQLHYFSHTIKNEQLSIPQLIQTIHHSYQTIFSQNRIPPVISLAKMQSYISTPHPVFIHIHLYICQLLMKHSYRFQIVIILTQIEKIQILYVYKPRLNPDQSGKDIFLLIAENQKLALNYVGTLVQYDSESLADLFNPELIYRCDGKCIGIELFEANDQLDDKYF